MILPLEIIIVLILEYSSKYFPICVENISKSTFISMYMYIKNIYIYNAVCTNTHFLIFKYVANTYVNKYIPPS